MTMMQGLSLTGVPVSATTKKRGESWLHDSLTHVKTMHRLLATLYDGLETDDVYEADFEDDEVLSVDGDSAKLTQIFADQCYKLVKRMTDPTKGPVEFPLTQMITVLSRCLTMTFADVLAVPSRADLATQLPRLYQCGMDVLSQMIVCCGRDILHHSRTIIDLCLQTIASTAKMPLDSKYRTRSSIYQVLVCWVKSCGWGKYLATHRKVLIQEIIADTQADSEDGLAKKSDSNDSKHDRFGGKGKKGKKKKGQRGDSYMELETKEDDKEKEQNIEARVDLVLWAFSLSQLAVEHLPFSLSQNLMSHLIKTSSTVQRLSNKPQPYGQTEARKGLYQAVAGCLLSPLESSSNRNDAVCHYQLTNSALDVLARACHGDHSQIQTVCSQALAILKSSSNLKGPVIRKVMDYDDNDVEDVSQLMRENEHQTDCIEDLRQKLMTSEMENEQQSRLISSMREQITSLQSKTSSVSQHSDPMTVMDESRKSQSDDKHGKIDDSDEDDDEDDDDEAQENTMDDEAMNTSSVDETQIDTGDGKKSNDKHPNSRTSNKKLTAELKTSTPKVNTDSGLKNKDLKKGKKFEDSKETPKKHVKRTNDADTSVEKDSKKSKVESKTNDNSIDDMLMDFVDAPPDS